jgi:geranylgeranyl reductase
MDNCKPCGGAIPLCMIDEFDLPMEIVDRKVRAVSPGAPGAVHVGHQVHG